MTSHSTTMLWAHFRFPVIGALLAAPPPRGELKAPIRSLADKVWTHLITGQEVQFAANTIERWYYKARKEQHDPVRVLRRAADPATGKVSLITGASAVTAEPVCCRKIASQMRRPVSISPPVSVLEVV